MGVARFALMMVLGILLPLAVQLWDRRRQTEAQRSAGWNVATWGSALYAFGPLSMLGWIFVTRRPWVRAFVAPLWTLPLVGVLMLVDMSFGLFLEGESVETSLGELLALSAGGYVAMAALLTLIEGGIWLRDRLRRTRPATGCPRPGGAGAL